MLTEKSIIIPIFRYSLKIVVFDSIKEFRDKYPDLLEDNPKGALIDYGDKSMICIPPNDMGTLIHECEHAKNAIWKRIGFIPTSENDEPDAYLVEYIYNETLKVIKKHLATKC